MISQFAIFMMSLTTICKIEQAVDNQFISLEKDHPFFLAPKHWIFYFDVAS